ncbi:MULTISPECIES: hypothetical protein [unclassified Burkholderia]|uniref:hypothetical protein n=1 Tax=unclassified Burkholderia TaxID=2613784 RepID=UPI002AAF4344|nr:MULTISPECIES: hypothetical protein [unclassified Burkholderia]
MTEPVDPQPPEDDSAEPVEHTVRAVVHTLPVKARRARSNRLFLDLVSPGKCWHQRQYLIDASLAEVVCGDCGQKLNPMWVLQQLMNKDHRIHELNETYEQQKKDLAERSRTKCEHCGKMTRISRR